MRCVPKRERGLITARVEGSRPGLKVTKNRSRERSRSNVGVRRQELVDRFPGARPEAREDRTTVDVRILDDQVAVLGDQRRVERGALPST